MTTSQDPSGTVEATGGADLAALTAFAADRKVAAADLDETVYEVANQAAANAYNAGEGGGEGDEADHDTLHDEADQSASEINNGGLEAQLRYLLDQWGAAATEAHLRSLTG